FGAAERTAERLGRGIVAHARAAAFAFEVVLRFVGRLILPFFFAARGFSAAVGAEQVLLVEQGAADGAFGEEVGHGEAEGTGNRDEGQGGASAGKSAGRFWTLCVALWTSIADSAARSSTRMMAITAIAIRFPDSGLSPACLPVWPLSK